MRHNRQNNQLRQIEIINNYTKHAEASVLVCYGDTKVICNASVLNKVPAHIKGTGQGWLTAEYSMLPRATHTRNDREISKGKANARNQEIQRLIGRSLRACFDLSCIKDYTIHIDCDVLQADGGTRTASITGSWVALCGAVKYMQNQGLINSSKFSINNIKQVAAVSVGVVGGEIMLDLNYEEDSKCDSDLNVVMCNDGLIVEIQGTAEGKMFSRNELNTMLDIAYDGIEQLFVIQNQSIFNFS